jgi:hypothetical protein
MLRQLTLGCLALLILGCRTPAGSGAAAPKAQLKNTIRWSTASEVNSFGFDVYRGDAEAGPFIRLTKTPVPAAGTSDTPRSYEFVDDTIAPDTVYYYYVESISLDGVRTRLTPVYPSRPKPAPGRK